MATFEERLTAVEHDNAELKQRIELQTMAIGGLVSKAMLERINEKNDKIFQALIHHDEFTNQQLAEFRAQVDQMDGKVDWVDGKIVGMQTEMRQRFAEMSHLFEQQGKQIADFNDEVVRQGHQLAQVLVLLNTLIDQRKQDQ